MITIIALVFGYLFLSFVMAGYIASIFDRDVSDLAKTEVILGLLWPLCIATIPIVIMGYIGFVMFKPFCKNINFKKIWQPKQISNPNYPENEIDHMRKAHEE